MRKTTLASGFSWKRGFLAHQQQRISHSQAPTNEAAKGPEEFARPEAPLAQFTNQRKIATRHPTENPSATATSNLAIDRASHTVCRQENSLFTTDVSSNQAKEATTVSPHTHTATTPHASREHDDGHIHRASPIRSLPPEQSFKPISLPETTRSVLLYPRHSQLKHTYQERTLLASKRNADSESPPRPQQTAKQTTSGKKISSYSRKACHDPPSPKLPDAKEGPGNVIRAFDEGLAYQDRRTSSQANSTDDASSSSTTIPGRVNSNGGQSFVRHSVGTKPTQGTYTSDKQEVTFAEELVTRSRFAWKKGFLATHNPPTRRPLPWSKPHYASTSTKLTTNTNATVSNDRGDKGQNFDVFHAASNWDASGIQVPHMAHTQNSLLKCYLS